VSETKPVVFVVDDDESVRGALEGLLRSAGFHAVTFDSAEEFMNSSHCSRCACLVLDVRMPGLSGLDLQKELAASGSNIPIIFMTAHDDDRAYSQAMKLGAIAFLRKPFDDQDLLDAIDVATRQCGSAYTENESF
jgi:FixJ family two-component response regulator